VAIRFLRPAALAVFSIAVLSVTGGLASGGEHTYVGSKKCKVCHIKEWTSWSKTKMALAFDVLKPGERGDAKKAAGLDPAKDYTKVPECLACHTVGFGQPGGFKDIETTPDLAGVGCEMCHGPGGTYTAKQYMSLQNPEYKKADLVAVGLVGEIRSETCTGRCHNDKSPFVKKGYVFDFAARRDQGIHERSPLKHAH
jgi:cytochrome c554/c'-like protein